MLKARSFIAVLTSVALLAGSPLLLADPGNKDKPHGNSHGNGNGKSHGNAGKGNDNDGGGNSYRGEPQIDIGGVRIVLGNNRQYWSAGKALPPGIQKNLARGKPLPPGIAKKLDNRLLGQLPRYDGYDWVQAGTDLILVTAATGLIYEVLHNVLD